MSETLTIDQKPTLRRLEDEKPEMYESIKRLPPHLLEHIGELLLKMTHIDMHPTIEKNYGSVVQKEKDLTRLILDSDDPAIEFDQNSIEAAKAGKEKLAKILHMSSATFSLAHAVLVARGHTFEGPENESEEDKEKRQTKDKCALVELACKMASDRALELKRSGSQAALLEQLESLNSISFFYPRYANDRPINTIYRNLVHEGLAEDIVVAGQESESIGTDHYYRSNKMVASQRELLSLATGKKLGRDFSIEGDLDIEKLYRIESINAFMDVVAIITSPNIDMTDEKRRILLDKIEGYTPLEPLKEKLDALKSYKEGSRYYYLLEKCKNESLSTFDVSREVISIDDPIGFEELAEKLGLKLDEALYLIVAPRQSFDHKQYLDRVGAEKLMELSAKHPILYAVLKSSSSRHRYNDAYGAILDAADKLKSSGITNTEAYESLLCSDPEPIQQLADTIIYAFEYAKKKKLSEAEFIEKISHGENGKETFWKIMRATNKSRVEGSSQKDLERILDSKIEDTIIESSVFKVYRDEYEKLSYPASPEKVDLIKIGLDQFPEIAAQIMKLGLDERTAKDIFASWATYNALMLQCYDNKLGFIPIKEMPAVGKMESILKKQYWALMHQLDVLKKYHSEYGESELKEIIEVFGIYNFGRHNPSTLHDQLERWKSGQSVETAVVEARADWNNYQGSTLKFEDQSQSAGLFYFEVNSATELSRIAVMIGDRERRQGREPDVRRFVVHAHGNPRGLTLGVNDESLNTSQYVDLAEKRKKIRSAEANDYKRHLGKNYSVILQSCSGAGETLGKNIASTMASEMDVPVTGAIDTISGIKIKADGTVEYASGYENTTRSITY